MQRKLHVPEARLQEFLPNRYANLSFHHYPVYQKPLPNLVTPGYILFYYNMHPAQHWVIEVCKTIPHNLYPTCNLYPILNHQQKLAKVRLAQGVVYS